MRITRQKYLKKKKAQGVVSELNINQYVDCIIFKEQQLTLESKSRAIFLETITNFSYTLLKILNCALPILKIFRIFCKLPSLFAAQVATSELWGPGASMRIQITSYFIHRPTGVQNNQLLKTMKRDFTDLQAYLIFVSPAIHKYEQNCMPT